MNNHVTPDTARALKAAGFPQPKTSAGQFWYDDEGDLYIILARNHHVHIDFFWPPKPFDPNEDAPDQTFAPTATDILKAINAPGYNLFYNPLSGEYFCNGAAHGRFDFFNHTNPAEAAAMMWLAVNKNK